jgi:hypothetical protein
MLVVRSLKLIFVVECGVGGSESCIFISPFLSVSLGARPFPLVEGNLHPRALVISSLHLKNSQIKSRPRDLAPYPDLLKSDRQNINNTPSMQQGEEDEQSVT